MRLILSVLCLLFVGFCFGQKKSTLDSVTSVLEAIYKDDQEPRRLLDSLQKKFDFSSPEVQHVFSIMKKQDSTNCEIVKSIIDRYGWLSSEESSQKANQTLFLVIQHADLNTQLNYLPMLRAAVENGKAKASEYALLVDRTNLRQGKFQVYGSQLSGDAKGNLYIDPIIDEPNVNYRRKEVGLGSMEEYAKHFGIVYKLPSEDTLKNKVFLKVLVFASGKPLEKVEVSSGSKTIGYTDKNGSLEHVMQKTSLKPLFIFSKEGYERATYTIDNLDKDIFQITVGLQTK